MRLLHRWELLPDVLANGMARRFVFTQIFLLNETMNKLCKIQARLHQLTVDHGHDALRRCNLAHVDTRFTVFDRISK